MTLPTKQCVACGLVRSAENFRFRPAHGGFGKTCIDCIAARTKKRLADVVRIVPDRKKCAGCGKTQPTEAYSPNPARKDGLKAKCKTCCSTYARYRRIMREVKPCPKARTETLVCSCCSKQFSLEPNQARGRRKNAKGGVVCCSRSCHGKVYNRSRNAAMARASETAILGLTG